jgi:hypothetical protein
MGYGPSERSQGESTIPAFVSRVQLQRSNTRDLQENSQTEPHTQFIENRNSDRSLSTVAQSLRAARMEFDIRTGQSGLPPPRLCTHQHWGPPSLLSAVFSKRIKRLRRDADHSLLSSTEIENSWSCTYTSQHVFMAR